MHWLDPFRLLVVGNLARVDPKATAALGAHFEKDGEIRVRGEAFECKGVLVVDVYGVAVESDRAIG